LNPKIPVISGRKLVNVLKAYGYEVVRTRGSHIRMRTETGGTHSITVPDHKEIDIGLLSAILTAVADHVGINKKELINKVESA